MKIKEFVEKYKAKRFINTSAGIDEKSEYIRETLGIKRYLPFVLKREIVEMVVRQNITVYDGIKKYDSISAYLGFVVAAIQAHTNLEFDDPISDYDLLAESGLLPKVVIEFKESYDEMDILLKMAVASELEDNNVNVLVGHFLNKILGMLDEVGGTLKEKLEKLDIKDFLGADINKEDLAKLSSFLNKLK